MQPGEDTSDESLREWVAQAEAKAERYQAMRAGVAEVSATGHSEDGVATATVDAAGNLADLHITDEVRRLSGERAAAAVLSAVRRAQSRLAGQVAEVVSSTVGEDESTMDTVLSGLTRRGQPRKSWKRLSPFVTLSFHHDSNRRNPANTRQRLTTVDERGEEEPIVRLNAARESRPACGQRGGVKADQGRIRRAGGTLGGRWLAADGPGVHARGARPGHGSPHAPL